MDVSHFSILSQIIGKVNTLQDMGRYLVRDMKLKERYTSGGTLYFINSYALRKL